MTAQRIDRILMALGVLLILISSYQLFFAVPETSSGPKLGTLTSTLSVVKTKNPLSLDWRDAAIGFELTENQLVYTDTESSAEIRFNEGNTLDVGENSLVRLISSNTEQGMNVTKGLITARLEGNKPLKVQMNGEDYLLSGEDADVQINIQDDKGEIGVLDGQVQVKGAGISERLDANTALEITGKKVKKKTIYYSGLVPSKGSILYTVSEVSSIPISWSPSEPAKIFVSKDQSFKDALFFSGPPGTAVQARPGLWYYKIEGDKGSSLVSSFRIIKEDAPVILRPKSKDEVVLLEEDPKILLQWKGEERSKYIVEWENESLKSSKVEGTRLLVPLSSGRPFRWRVKISDKKRPDAVWSDWQTPFLKFLSLPAVPSGLAPDGVEYLTYEKESGNIALSWSGEGPFELEVKNPAGEIKAEKILSTFHNYIADTPGAYSWRVRSVDDYLRTSEWSGWKSFIVKDVSSEMSAGIQKIQLLKPDQAVTFSWNYQEGAENLFELSRDESFENVVRKINVEKDSVQVNIPEVGSYYWRSRRVLPDGTFETSAPRRVIVEPVPPPGKPEKLPDLEVPLHKIPIKSSFLKLLMNILISEAHAEDSKGVVQVNLPVAQDAKAYVVRIFRDKELKDMVLEKELSTKMFEWKNAEAGEYYLQYAVIDYWDRRSLFSDPSQLTVKAEVPSLPAKPRLLSPIRAVEINSSELVLKWTHDPETENYKVQISNTRNFKNVVHERVTDRSEAKFTDTALEAKLHYWRVIAHKKDQQNVSNTGRFIIRPALEKTVIEDHPLAWQKKWRRRAFLSWTPSQDTYSFEDGPAGEISGTALMGVSVSGTVFREKTILNADYLRQSGKVFDGEAYLFQRILADAVYIFKKNQASLWSAGTAIGQSTGSVYAINNNQVSAESISGLNYGPIVRHYYAFNEQWEIQNRFVYLLGEIKQLEIGSEIIHTNKKFLLIGGAAYISREYEINSAKQSSFRVSFGIGKNF